MIFEQEKESFFKSNFEHFDNKNWQRFNRSARIFQRYYNQIKKLVQFSKFQAFKRNFLNVISPHQSVQIPLLIMGQTSVGKTTLLHHLLSIQQNKLLEFGLSKQTPNTISFYEYHLTDKNSYSLKRKGGDFLIYEERCVEEFLVQFHKIQEIDQLRIQKLIRMSKSDKGRKKLSNEVEISIFQVYLPKNNHNFLEFQGCKFVLVDSPGFQVANCDQMLIRYIREREIAPYGILLVDFTKSVAGTQKNIEILQFVNQEFNRQLDLGVVFTKLPKERANIENNVKAQYEEKMSLEELQEIYNLVQALLDSKEQRFKQELKGLKVKRYFKFNVKVRSLQNKEMKHNQIQKIGYLQRRNGKISQKFLKDLLYDFIIKEGILIKLFYQQKLRFSSILKICYGTLNLSSVYLNQVLTNLNSRKIYEALLYLSDLAIEKAKTDLYYQKFKIKKSFQDAFAKRWQSQIKRISINWFQQQVKKILHSFNKKHPDIIKQIQQITFQLSQQMRSSTQKYVESCSLEYIIDKLVDSIVMKIIQVIFNAIGAAFRYTIGLIWQLIWDREQVIQQTRVEMRKKITKKQKNIIQTIQQEFAKIKVPGDHKLSQLKIQLLKLTTEMLKKLNS